MSHILQKGADILMKRIKIFLAILVVMSIAVTLPSTVEASCIGQVKKITNWKRVPIPNQQGDGVRYQITWKKVKGAAGYQVKIYEKEDPSEKEWYARTQFTKKTKAYTEFSSLYALKGKVRAYKVIKGKKVYGKWSKIVKKIINY